MVERFLIVWLCLLSIVAYAWNDSIPFDPFLATKAFLEPLIALAMFAIGWMLPADEVRQVARRWPTVLGGTAVQYTAMPGLALLFATALRLDRDAFMGVIMAGCVPGAMASNVLTLVARGNVSYSVSLTTAATLLSPLVVPAALWLTVSTRVEIPLFDTAWKLCWMVVAPVACGHLLGRALPWFEKGAQRIGAVTANLVILWVIAVVVARNRDSIAETQAIVVAALVGLNVCGYAAGYGAGAAMRLPDAMRRALTLEIGMQNAGLGSVLAMELFPDHPAIAIPPALYSFGCMFTGAALARLWGMRPPAGSSDPQGAPAEV